MADHGEHLERAGFSKREAAVYLALMHIGAATPSAISKYAKVKRSTVYNIIEELVRSGLVAEIPKEKRKQYVALSPEHIVEHLKSKTESIRSVLPELLALHSGPKQRPRVSLYDDQAGLASVYAEIVDEQNAEICAFLSLDAIPAHLAGEAFDKFIELYSKPGIKVRELIHTSNDNHPYLKKVFGVRNYQGRISPLPFFTDSIIYGNRVALFSFKDKFALVIQSKTIADSLRSLFDLAWKQVGQD